MTKASVEIKVKVGKKWETTYTNKNVKDVYRRLSEDLIAKKMHKCSYISRITDRNNYNGTRTIEVYYKNGANDSSNIISKAVYTIANMF